MTWKFLQIKPMKARGRLLESMWDNPEWVAEEKYDGDRRVGQFCGQYLRMTGTRESVDGTGFVEKTTNLPHLTNLPVGRLIASHAQKLEGTVLDGEIILPSNIHTVGGASKYVTAIMGSKPEMAIKKQHECGWLRYMVFDCLWHNGRDIRGEEFRERRNHAEQVVREWGNSYVSLASQAAGVGKRQFYDRIVGRGGEGVVLKRVDSRYGDQTLWVKVKAETTADVVVMGYKPGKGQHAGKVGAIIFGQNVIPPGNRGYRLRPCGTARGFDFQTMATLTNHGKKFLGHVFEIKHNGREPTGAFRHPRFSRWRPDKAPKDCVYDPEET